MGLLHICRWCGDKFEMTKNDKVFYEKVSPVFRGKKYVIPPPSLCVSCREQRRLTWRNDRTFFQRVCDMCGEHIISHYPHSVSFPVYHPKEWYGDGWNPLDYGKEFDESQPFLKQWVDVQNKVPHLGMDIVNCENSEYCNYCGDNKNCYLDIAGEGNEDCYYNLFTKYSKDCMDCTFVYNSQLCYESINCYNGYNVHYGIYLENCHDCLFCFDLKGCNNCLFSGNLRQKQYYIFNKPYSKEEYLQEKEKVLNGSYRQLKMAIQRWKDMTRQSIHRDMYGFSSENCVGNNIKNSKNCFGVFNISDCEDCRYMYDVLEAKDCQDLNYSLYDPEVSYELISTLSMKYSAFNMASHYCHNVFYCELCNSCENCFGCISLRNASYCILNKQYTKEEYEALVPKIIEKMIADGEWGEFFPPRLSPFGYNETVAQEYFPLTKEEALKKGFNWSDYVPPPPNVEKILTKEQMKKLPDSIKDIPDDILNWALTCEVTGKPFKIIKPELKFYREHNISIPRRHPDQRHRDRMALRNPRKLWKRQCMKCNKEIQTTYSPERPEIVYCEECYLKEVY